MIDALDGPSKQGLLASVGTVTPIEVRVGASAFSDRKVVTLQGNNKFYVYFADEGETPSAATITANGFIQFKDQKESYEAGERQKVFVLSASGTVNIRIAERA